MNKLCSRGLMAFVFLALVMAGTQSCSRYGRSKGQNIGFATFIKAYTGGIISDKSTILVELTSDVPGARPGADVKERTLTFQPPVKGTARWASPNTIEFIPEDGALKPGQSYSARLNLDKIGKVKGRQFKRFYFKFLVAIKEAVLSIDDMLITAAAPDKANVSGTISLTAELPLEKVQKMLEYNYPDQSAEVNVTVGTDELHYSFEILNLPRDTKDRTLKVSLKAGDTGFVAESRLETVIPAMGRFGILRAECDASEDPHIDVYFTEPLDKDADCQGLVFLEGATSYYTQIQDSKARIYFDLPFSDRIGLFVSESLKSYDGSRLGNDFSKEFSPYDEKPAVEIPVSGAILPNSKELMLPFRAVNLKAVDIKVIQIYEDNVLTFLQDNDLGGDNSLRRSGRLVYKRCVRLDTDPSKNIHKWHTYSVDLSGLFKQEHGAIYRIQISFKQDYSVYGESSAFRSGAPTGKMVDLSLEQTEEDDEEWDKPYPDYYESYFDWDKFVWQDRDDPLKPTYYMDESRFPSINLLNSNLGVIAKYSGGDKIWVSVSDILSALPIFNAELYAYSYQLKEIGYAKTGTDGMAEIALSGKPFAIVARRGESTSYLKVTEGDENSLSRFDVGGKTLDKGLKAYIYGERGVWRPGDTLHVALILEDKEGRIPDSHPAVMELYTPGGQYYTKLVNSNAKDNFYVFDIPTKTEDPTGSWNAYFKIGGATFHKPLRIESIKPNRLKVNLELGSEVIEAGKSTTVGISSNWLTGPAAAGLDAKVEMTLRRKEAPFKGFEGFTFTDPTSEFTSSTHRIVRTKLNNDGQAHISVQMPSAEDAPGLLQADFVTSVEEKGGDVSFSTLSTAYSPFSSYVGVKVPRESGSRYLETDRDYSIRIADVDKDGKRVIGHELEYSVYKLKWSWWWESGRESLDSYVNGTMSDPVARGKLVSGNYDCSIPFKVEYPSWGRYLVIVRDMDSGHTAGEIFYVDWPSYRGRSAKTDPSALSMLSFSTDKESYEIGETATVYIPAAAKGEALVSLENSHEVISREWVKTSGEGDAVYTFKVTPQMAPNFYVHITLVQPHRNAGNDLPIRLYGVQPVTVNNKESHLEPVITMPDVIHPEEEFSIRIKEKNNKGMTYTLAIVDEGLLDITSFKTPDPWKYMNEREALGVRTWDLYDEVVGAYSGRFSPMFSIGGDESLLMSAKRDNRFNPVVAFIGPFTLQSGAAVHKIRLPMYVGSVRVMVVAARDGAYGNAEKTVPVRSPLMVLPTLPRVLGTGEKVSLPVNVFALEDEVKNVEVSVKAEGSAVIKGSSRTSIAFSAPGDRLVAFPLEATGEGTAKITVSASGGGHKAAQTIEVQVRNPNPAVVAVSHAEIGKGETKKFSFAPFKSNDAERAVLELAGFPSLDVNSLLEYAGGDGSDITGELASKGIILLSVREMLPEKRRNENDSKIADLVQQICQRQLSNGGFARWKGSSDTDNWVSSLSGEFLVRASKEGFAVSKGVLAGWSRFQKKSVQEYRSSSDDNLWDFEQAYRLYTLALNSETESGAMNRLRGSEKLSWQARCMLAAAYSLSGKKAVAVEIIEGLKLDLSDYSQSDRTQSDFAYGSPVLYRAIALESLVLADELEQAIDLAHRIKRSAGDGWYSVQAAAFSAKTMTMLAQKVGSDRSIDVTIANGDNSEDVKTAKSQWMSDVDSRSGSVSVKNNSGSTVFATFTTVSAAPAWSKVEARSNGLSIRAVYTDEMGNAVNPASLAQGTDFSVAVTVGNHSGVRDYSQMVLCEAVPSGWEIVDEKSPSGGVAEYSYKDVRDDRVLWYFDLPRGASKTFRMRMRATYEGEFVLPAVECRGVNDSRISANTASGIAKVIR